MFTDRDEEIRNADLPERFQLRELSYRTPSAGELPYEALWIGMVIKRRKQLRDELVMEHPLVKAIEKILGFLRVDCLEVPFILRHRRDYFEPILNDADIWDIYDDDMRWNHIIQRKAALKKWSVIIPELDDLVTGASDESDIKDLADYLQLRYKKEMAEHRELDENGEALTTDGSRKYKRPVRKDIYILAKENGLAEFGKVRRRFFL